MTTPTNDPEVVNNTDQSRYEIGVDGQVAGFAAYQRRGNTIVFTHTEIDDDREGEGLGGRLIGAALDHARQTGAQVVPECPFVAEYIRRHPA